MRKIDCATWSEFEGSIKAQDRLSILDDYSRYLLALKPVDSTGGKGVMRIFQETSETSGLPEFLLVDHGTPWYNTMGPWGWTEATVCFMRQGVRVIFSGVRHPQTQGKVERMHGSLQRAIGKRKVQADAQFLEAFRHEYNHVRPHEGIGMVTPATRWQPSPRQFQSNPPEWQYPADWEVQRLAGEGQLGWHGQRWEVSRALRGQLVGLQRVNDRVLVHFCNVALREIDLRTGRNSALPANPFRQLRF